MIWFFTTVFYQPLYNGLIYLMDLLPWIDAGVAVILFTIIIRLIIFPLSVQSVKTQMRMRQLEPELAAIKEKYKNNRDELARKTLELYRVNDIHPFSGIFLILIQLPIIIALYSIFSHGGLFVANTELLYGFVKAPASINAHFLSFIDISKNSLWLALLAAISQFFQVRFSVPPPKPRSNNASFQDDLARSMNIQMRYVLPVFIFFIAWKIVAAVSLYWITFNSYIPFVFNLLIGVSFALAFIMIIWGGVEYMSTDAISGKSSGREKIKNALWGLLLVLGAYIILQTINPNLVNFRIDQITNPGSNTTQ